MSMDKWLSAKNSVQKEDKDDIPISEEKMEELKKKTIRQLLNGKNSNKKSASASKSHESNQEDGFFSYFLQFKDWLDGRTYLKGDMDKIEVWIKNLYHKIETQNTIDQEPQLNNKKIKAMYKEIPPDFLEDGIRIALNQKINGRTLTNSNKYYLKKVKSLILDKLKEAEHYETLKQILEFLDK